MSTVPEEPIVITADEANGTHVDDLLKRQMSLRGEGVASEPAKRWYYRNWLLFMIVGAIAATAAWGIIEPLFDDFLYTQGRITALSDEVLNPRQASAAADEEAALGEGWVKVRDQQVWLAPGLRQINHSRARTPFDISTLKEGEEVGLYTKYFSGARNDLAIAYYIDPAPATPAHGKGVQPLAEQSSRNATMSFLVFSIVAGLIGLGIGAADGIVCHLPRRAILGGLIGLLVGFVGGLLSHVIANVIYVPISHLASVQLNSSSQASRSFGFLLQMIGRMFAWTLAGCAMGLGQGIALRSKRLLAYGFLGGVIGGLLGGLLFDPLDMIILSGDRVGAEWSRMIGFLVIGAAVGAMIGLVELLSRDAWLRMVEGPLAGKEFLLLKDAMKLGSSPKCDIYLFNDPLVADVHATLRSVGDHCELENEHRPNPVLINGRPASLSRLRHGDQIAIGRTVFVFERRQGA